MQAWPALWMRLAAISAGCAALALFGCAASTPTEVHSSFGPGAKYEGLGSTFQWSPQAAETMKAQAAERPYLHGIIVDAVESELTRKGYSKTDGSADLWVVYQVNAREEVEGLSGEAYLSGEYGLTIFDPHTSKKIYSGSARIRVNPKSDPAGRKATVDNVTRRMLADFPASRKK